MCSEEADTPVLVWGAGAMGGTIGASLVRAGHAVRFVDREATHVGAMCEAGLEVRGPVASFSVPADACTPEELEGRYSRALLCVKAHDTAEAIDQLAPFLSDTGYVVSIQNGLNEAVIADRVGVHRTVGAFVNFGADYLAPGVVHWGGRGAVVLGELNGERTERIRDLHSLLQAFEPGAIVTSNIQGYLWSKLSYAALLFATALTDEAIADVLDAERYRPILVEIAREVCRVAERSGVALEPFDGFDPSSFGSGADDAAAFRSMRDLVAFNRRSAKTHSGIWRDLAVRRRKTEVDAQLRPIVATGDRFRVPTPLVQSLIVQIHQIEDGQRRMSWDNLEELR